MAAFPPSYDEATSRDPWPTILGYLSSGTLCKTSQVCRKWYRISVGYLWRDPRANFGNDDSAIQGLVKFLESLSIASLGVRQITHSLRFPRAHIEAYGGFNHDWLRETLDLLPNLKLLHVRRLSFFEHTTLLKLRHSRTSGRVHTGALTFGLRYLDAAGCIYLSAESLYQVLQQFPQLILLNLSSVYPAVELSRSISPLRALKHLPYLRVLKLCKVGLRDVHVEILANTLQHSLKYLDIRQNHITDKTCETLRSRFLCEPSPEAEPPRSLFNPEYHLFEVSDENLDERLEHLLTNEDFDISVLDQVASPTLSHLQISGNTHVTPSALITMLTENKLTSLDASIPQIPSHMRFDPITLPIEDTRLRYLRVHWSFLQVSSDTFTNLPALRVLTLTNIPATSKDPIVVDTLLMLFSSAGRHASTQRENIRKSNALPPGRRTLAGLKAQTRVQFPLRKITLEIERGGSSTASKSHNNDSSSKTIGKETLSPIGDEDSEVFYAASRDDFSFFEEPENRRETEQQKQRTQQDTIVAESRNAQVVDTVKHIAAIRKRQREEYEAREVNFVFSSDTTEHKEWKPEEYWEGEVAVLRE